MKITTIIAVLVALVVVGGGYWYWSNVAQAPSGSAGLNISPNEDNGTSQQPQTKSATVIVASTNAALGSFLSSPVTGMTLYTYAKDTAAISNCSDTCAANWPPYRVEPGITLLGGAGLSGQLGTITRADGGLQLTYNGAPLYTYVKDTNPGDTVGQGVGGVWYVVKP